jgi:two-component system cell cycle response regulator DivK
MTKRILVVEDQADLRGILRDLLTGSGYEVGEAVDGRDGVAKAKSKRPDLILMDIQLPVLDGYETTRQIKTDPNLKATPIIAVSSYAMKGDEDKARTSGCDHYVTKPYSPVQLLRIILTRREGVRIDTGQVCGSAFELKASRTRLRLGVKSTPAVGTRGRPLLPQLRRSEVRSTTSVQIQ